MKQLPVNEILVGDALERLRELPDCSVHCCVTSPPYWGLRDYGVNGQIGLEKTPEEYVTRMAGLFGEVRRVLRDDGTLWLNLGDSYNGYMANQRATSISANNQQARPKFESGRGRRTETLKAKDLVGIPWRVAFALQADGWYLRSDIIWSKPNPMPESVTDRPTKAHEYLFLMSKNERYYYDAGAIRETGAEPGRIRCDRIGGVTGDRVRHSPGGLMGQSASRNRQSVWTITTSPFPEAHFAVFPEKLIEPCIMAGCPAGGAVLDPFMGAGTTALVALKCGRQFVGIELNPEYAKMAEARIWNEKNQTRLC